MTDYLFVYGTLRRNYDLKLKDRVARDLRYIGQAKVGATLYDLGKYPGAIRSSKGREVVGDVFRIDDPDRVLRILDKYEGIGEKTPHQSEFIRKKVRLKLRSGKELTAWVYWYNRDPGERTPIRYKDYLNYLKNKSIQ